MSGLLSVTPDGERAIGLAFLEGQSVSGIASFHALRRDTVEKVLRAQMRHLIEAKRPDPVRAEGSA